MKILNQPTSTIKQVIAWLEKKNPHFLAYSMVPIFFTTAIAEGVDPTVVIAQAMKETGYFKFTGVLKPNFCNTCGLKVAEGGGDTDPNAHNRFEYWEHGILAHVEHLALYAGQTGYPKSNPMDTRHFAYLLGKCPNVEDLSGNWAPGLTYGQDIVSMCNDIINTVVNDEKVEHICPTIPDHECPTQPEHVCPEVPDNSNDICNQLTNKLLELDPNITHINMRLSANGKSVGKYYRVQ